MTVSHWSAASPSLTLPRVGGGDFSARPSYAIALACGLGSGVPSHEPRGLASKLRSVHLPSDSRPIALAAAPPIQLRLSSLRSLRLRILPPQGGKRSVL